MNHIINTFESILKNKKFPKKIICRNSYERFIVHELAVKNNLYHRVIIDYTATHTNQECFFHSKILGDRYKVYITPTSYIEISNSKLELNIIIIGYKELIPEGLVTTVYYGNKHSLNFCARKLKQTHSENLKIYKTTLPAYLLTLICCLHDGYFKTPDQSIKSRSKKVRFYKICILLPLELQKIICNIVYTGKFKLEISSNLITMYAKILLN